MIELLNPKHHAQQNTLEKQLVARCQLRVPVRLAVLPL
jgi:hypothetical protein